jgi:predicted RecA/RadA family phage recombinase
MATGLYLKDGMGPLTVDYTCTGAVAVNTIRIFGTVNANPSSLGLARTAGVTGDVIAFDIGGCYTMPCTTGSAISLGGAVNWDASASALEDETHAANAAGDIANCAVALAAKAAGSGLNTVDVQLLPGVGLYATG